MYIDLLCVGACTDPPELRSGNAYYLQDEMKGTSRIALHIAPYRDDEGCLCDDISKCYEFMERKGYGLEAVNIIQYPGRNQRKQMKRKEKTQFVPSPIGT
jgi:hypothetical protein